MTKNVRLLIVCENKKQTEKLYEHIEKKAGKREYVDTCYYHGEEKAVIIESKTDNADALTESVANINVAAKEIGVTIKHFAFESGF